MFVDAGHRRVRARVLALWNSGAAPVVTAAPPLPSDSSSGSSGSSALRLRRAALRWTRGPRDHSLLAPWLFSHRPDTRRKAVKRQFTEEKNEKKIDVFLFESSAVARDDQLEVIALFNL